MKEFYRLYVFLFINFTISLPSVFSTNVNSKKLQPSHGIEAYTEYKPSDVVNGYRLSQQMMLLGLHTHHMPRHNWKSLHSSRRYITSSRNNNSNAHVSEEENPTSVSKYKERKSCQHCPNCEDSAYCLDENIFHGGHGEIWRAHRVNIEGDILSEESYVLKRMITYHRPDIKRCALREIYFGELFRGQLSFPRYITYFLAGRGEENNFSNIHPGHYRGKDSVHDDNEKDGYEEYWLVFRDEGISLQSFLYTFQQKTSSPSASAAVDPPILQPSRAWHRLRSSSQGQASMKSILYQIIYHVQLLHEQKIIHRDLKPSNILLNVLEGQKPRLVISDFSSAVRIKDGWTREERCFYYGGSGAGGEDDRRGGTSGEGGRPSILEETLAYAPPEVLLSIGTPAGIAYDVRRPESYDIWSIGVIFLEMLLGTSEVFTLDQRNQVLIRQLVKNRLRKNKKNKKHNKPKKKKTKTADDDVSDQIREGTTSGGFNQIEEEEEQAIKNAILLASLADYCIYQQNNNNNQQESEEENGVDKREAVQPTTHQQPHHLHQHRSHNWMKQSKRLIDSMITLSQDNAEEDANSVRSTLIFSSSSSSSSSRSSSCSWQHLADAILRRDPLGKGFYDRWGLDLLSRLLHFDPMKRMNLSQALQHAYFQGAYVSSLSAATTTTTTTTTGSVSLEESATREDLEEYERRWLAAQQGNKQQQQPSGGQGKQQATMKDEKKVVTIIHQSSLLEGKSNNNELSVENGLLPMSLTLEQQVVELQQKQHNILLNEFYLHMLLLQYHYPHPRMDNTRMNQQRSNYLDAITYTCPVCHRAYPQGDWQACHRHVAARKHGQYCLYSDGSSNEEADNEVEGSMQTTEKAIIIPSIISQSSPVFPSTSFTSVSSAVPLPILHTNEVFLTHHFPFSCMSTSLHNPLLPSHIASGWCDLQGKRKYMEDYHTIFMIQEDDNDDEVDGVDEEDDDELDQVDEAARDSNQDKQTNNKRRRRRRGVMKKGKGYEFYGVYDGHFGAIAARYAGERIHEIFVDRLAEQQQQQQQQQQQTMRKEDNNYSHDLDLIVSASSSSSSAAVVGSMTTATDFDCQAMEDSAAIFQRIKDLKARQHSAAGNGQQAKNVQSAATPASSSSSTSSSLSVLLLDDQELVSYYSPPAHNITIQQLRSLLHSSFLQVDRELTLLYQEEQLIRHQQMVHEHHHQAGHPETASSSEIGGTTATIAILYHHHNGNDDNISRRMLLLGHIGDSRAILCCTRSSSSPSSSHQPLAIQLSRDHNAEDVYEQGLVEERGGRIEVIDGMKRVNGKLIVTRSLGDAEMGSVIGSKPEIIAIDLTPRRSRLRKKDDDEDNEQEDVSHLPFSNSCQQYQRQRRTDNRKRKDDNDLEDDGGEYLFLILATDGLWDVMTNQEAVEMVCAFLLEINEQQEQQPVEEEEHQGVPHSDTIADEEGSMQQERLDSITRQRRAGQSHHPLAIAQEKPDRLNHPPHDTYQRIARLLAYEALVRGSLDNIGVCVINLQSSSSR